MTSYVPSSLLRVILSAFEILEAAAERKERTKCNFFLFVFEQLKTELARVKSSHPHLIHKAAWEMACRNYKVKLLQYVRKNLDNAKVINPSSL